MSLDYFGYAPIDSGIVTTVQGVPTKPVEPTEETIVAGAGWMRNIAFSLGRSVDDLTALLTARVYEQMLTDPVVASSFGSLKLSIMSGGIKFVSPIKQPAWSKRPKPGGAPETGGGTADGGESTDTATRDKTLTPEQVEAKEVYKFCERNARKVMEDIRRSSFALLDAMAFGVKLAETTYEVPEEGIDAGKLCLKSIKVKPNNRWYFVVDNTYNVLGVLTFNPGVGMEVWPPEKFAWLSWMMKDADPRGNSQLRAAHAAWNLKVQTWPEYYAHIRRFGSGGMTYEMAEGEAAKRFPALNADGTLNTTPGTPAMDGPNYYSIAIGVGYKNGGVFVHNNTGKFTHWEPNNNGEAFLNAFRIFDEQITQGIQYEHTSAMDSKNSSRAQSKTGQDTKAPVIQFGRDELALVYYRIFHQLTTLNYGKDVADRVTPMPTFGNAEGHDRAALWVAAGSIGYKLGPSQIEEMSEELGLPIPDPEADAQAAADAMQQQASLMGPPGGNDSKPPAKKSTP